MPENIENSVLFRKENAQDDLLKKPPEMETDIQMIIASEKATCATKIKSILYENYSVKISTSTIKNFLKRKVYHYVKPRTIPFLTKKHIENGLLWTKRHEKTNWKKVMFSDESGVQTLQNCIKVWSPTPAREVKKMPKFQRKLMFWAGIYFGGRTKIHIIEGIMTAQVYRGIVDTHVKPLFSKKNRSKLIFQQDNDPKHTSKLLKEYLLQKKYDYLNGQPVAPI